jgi:hypothetical protein
MNFAARLGCTAVGLRPPSVAPQTRLKPTTETRQRSTYKKAKAVQTNGATSAGFGQAIGVFDRDVLGGFKWSSQHLHEGGCDEEAQAAFGSMWASAIVVTRSTVGGGTR